MAPHTTTVASPSAALEKIELLELLSAVGDAICQDFDIAASGYGLTHLQVQVVTFVSKHPVPMRSIAARLACDASNITGIVDRLEAGGFVCREGSLTDRRVKNVIATSAGRDAIRSIRAKMQAHIAIDVLTPNERQMLYEALTRLRNELTLRPQKGSK